tara:strand:- start:146 stop:265 length:120 start_codon:yes stop_codon:yes gene_type:complete
MKMEVEELNIYNWMKEYCSFDSIVLNAAVILCNIKNSKK